MLFSSDVEATALRLLQNRSLKGRGACRLAQGLPLVGYTASIACLARRERPLNHYVQQLVARYEAKRELLTQESGRSWSSSPGFTIDPGRNQCTLM